MMQMTPLLWVFLGVTLMILEVTTPGFVLFFFGLSALSVALVTWLAPTLAAPWQWLLFSALSVVYIVLMRKWIKSLFDGRQEVSESPDEPFVGKRALVLEAIDPARPGRVELSGTGWTAESNVAIPAGDMVRVVGQKNLTLRVEPF